MKKKEKISIKDQVVSKSVKELFVDQRSQLLRTLNEESIQELAKDIIKWVDKDTDMLKFGQIYEKIGILPKEFDRLAEKYPSIKRAREFCILIFGNRREVRGLRNELNAGLVATSMPLYDEDWKNLIMWKADLSTKNQQGYQNIVVQMAPIPNSDLVSHKKSESVDVGDDNV